MSRILTRQETEMIQERISLFAAFALDREFAELLEHYVKVSRPQWDGTMDTLLPHFFSIREMRKAQANLRYLCEVAQHILDVRKLAIEQLARESGTAA